MIVVDSSAVVAILLRAPSASVLLECLNTDADRMMSVASYIESGAVLAGRRKTNPAQAIDDLDDFLIEAGIALVPVDVRQARLALRARVRYGRGMGHGGMLNFGDVFSYALARLNDAPLLFIGNDFSGTDVEVALKSGED